MICRIMLIGFFVEMLYVNTVTMLKMRFLKHVLDAGIVDGII